LLPTYASLGAWAPVLLLLLRILQGAAVGGEVPGAWVFVSEHVPPSRVGLACGVLTAGLTGGILLGSLVATGLNMLMPPEQLTAYGWRLPFLLGGAFGLMSMYLRYLLTETPVFEELKKRRALSVEMPLKAVVRDYRGAIVLSGLLTWMLSAAIVVVILMTPALLEKVYKLPAVATLQANCVATIGLTGGCVLAGWLTDRLGVARVLLVGCPLAGIAGYLLYASVRVDSSLLMPLYALAGFTVGIVAVVPCVMIAAFPPQNQILRHLLFLQSCIRDLRWADSDSRIVAAPLRSSGAGALCRSALPARFWSWGFSFFDGATSDRSGMISVAVEISARPRFHRRHRRQCDLFGS